MSHRPGLDVEISFLEDRVVLRLRAVPPGAAAELRRIGCCALAIGARSIEVVGPPDVIRDRTVATQVAVLRERCQERGGSLDVRALHPSGLAGPGHGERG